MSLKPHPITCILPPHIVDHIVENGSDAQRDRALTTQRVSMQFRAQRVALAAQKPAPSIPMPAIAAVKNRVIY